MCMFSDSVESVSGTKIFCRATDAVRQCIVYSMQYEAAADLATSRAAPLGRELPRVCRSLGL